MPVANLEIFLFRRDAGNASVSYGIELRFAAAGSENEKAASGATPLDTDDPEFRTRGLDAAAYGSYLADRLLAEPAIRGFFDQARAAAQTQDASLHIRLAVGADAAELHSLRWEMLRLPGGASVSAATLTGEKLTFSRYLATLDWRPVRPRSAADIRALIVIADPSDAARFRLAPVNKAQELAAARAGLGDIPASELATRGQVTLNNIVAASRDGRDILYLVAHGMLVDGEPWLFLEKEDGSADRAPGRELATRIHELEDRPRLVVLISCQSAGTGAAGAHAAETASREDGILAALGPRLAEAGVPAVIAVQGNITMQTAAAFMPIFFRELRRDGLADRAMSVARGAVRDRPDWWMPVLFTGLKGGRIWEPAGPDSSRAPGSPQAAARPPGAQIGVSQQVSGDVSGEVTGVKVGAVQGDVTFQGPVTVTVPGLAAELVSRLVSGAMPPAEDLHRSVIDIKPFEPETVYVPAGPFLMGADPGEGIPDYETPQHPVTLPAYRIGRFPVTNRQYAEFIRREKAHDVPKDAGWFLREPPPDRLDHPVTGVSWGDAVAYCRWLSSQIGRRYRLPNEAEWEKAAAWDGQGDGETSRQGNKGTRRRYPWGDEWGEGWCNAGGSGTTPVTAHPAGASLCGCEDMLGNVQEWTATLWGTQSAQPQQSYQDRPGGGPSIADSADLPAQARLVHRGGSYRSQPGELRCSARGSAAPDSRIPWRGFRVAMEV